MRAVVAEETKVGLLLFDEPSASLDPVAEHGEAVIAHRRIASTDISTRLDLFERLRKLKGDKTMIFSSHRFGNLTRHADLILYAAI